MIEILTQPRQSGNTTYLVNLYKTDGGIYVVQSAATIEWLHRRCDIDKADIYMYSTLKAGMLRNRNRHKTNIYIDELYYCDPDAFREIIRLDILDFNIIIRYTPFANKTLPDFFVEYLEEKYPEYCI